MDSPKWIGEKELSKIVGRATQTLRNDRHNGKGIPYSKFGASIRYKLSDVLEFMDSHKVFPEKNDSGLVK